MVRVIEHRLRLARDGQDGGDGEHRVEAPQRLRAQQKGIRTIHDSICHICRLSPAPHVSDRLEEYAQVGSRSHADVG